MAEPTSSGEKSRGSWRGRAAGIALIVVGLAGVAIGAAAYLDAWNTAQQWDTSEEAQALERQEMAPTPVWIEPGTPASAGSTFAISGTDSLSDDICRLKIGVVK